MKNIICWLCWAWSILLFIPVTIDATNNELVAWVITDLHYLSESLHDKDGEAYQHIKNTGAGKDFDYGAERMQALTQEITQEKPDVLIISGDLTLNGEYQSMLDLAEYFRNIEALGTDVFVIPGNHDIASGWAREFKGESFIKTRQVLNHEFATIFDEFGYQEAISRDSDSLSYVAALNHNYWLLMLDSNLYSDVEGVGAPKVNGLLSQTTLQWIDNIFQLAQNKNKRIIPVIHHNTITHYQALDSKYTLDNADELRDILFKYGTPFTLSGHIHTQHYATIESANHELLTDIVTGAFASYPSYIGKITFTNNAITYKAEPLAMTDYAITNSIINPQLRDYSNYMKHLFDDSSHKMAYGEMIEGGWYQKNDPLLEEVAQYVAALNLAFFAGKPINTLDLQDIPNIEKIQQLIDDNAASFFKDYLKMILDNQTDYTKIRNIHW